MQRLIIAFISLFLLSSVTLPAKAVADSGVRIKDLARIKGIRENALVGYGIVVGLAGSGDTARTKATYQSIANTLIKFGVTVDKNEVQSRNVASVMVTANLRPFAETGDSFDVTVSSMGDAKSLVGGTLLLTPLNAPNGKTYALAQGQLAVGGYKYDAFGNVVQKNHPTVGIVPKGATVERDTVTDFFVDGKVQLILNEPDFTTADRIVSRLSAAYPQVRVEAMNAGKIKLQPKYEISRNKLTRLISEVENLSVTPDIKARVVVNERTGTVVSGGNVRISAVSISHGSLKLKIDTQYAVSQPTLLSRPTENISTQVVPQTDINVEESGESVNMKQGASVSDLVAALQAINLSTRDIISILQAIKQAGALHAELIIQ